MWKKIKEYLYGKKINYSNDQIETVEHIVKKEKIKPNINIDHRWGGGFYKEPKEKNKIVIHHTDNETNVKFAMGYLETTSKKIFNKKGYYVGVAYWIDRNGDIYQAFDDSYWAYHAGSGSINYEQSSIAIELENVGYFEYKNNKLVNRYGRKKLKHQKLYENPITWRKKKLFEYYPEKQINSLIELLEYLFDKYPTIPRNIPQDFFPERKWNKGKYVNYKGILTHLHTNSNSKWDVSIAFSLWFEKITKELNLKKTY